jgi:AcrR family transcriptional regulator
MTFVAGRASTIAVIDSLADSLAKCRTCKMEECDLAADLEMMLGLLQTLHQFPEGLDVMRDLMLFLNEVLSHPHSLFLHAATRMASYAIAHLPDSLQSFADSDMAASLISIFKHPQKTAHTKTVVLDVVLQIVGHKGGTSLALDCGLLRLAVESPADAIKLQILCVFAAVPPQEAIVVALDAILRKVTQAWMNPAHTGIASGASDCVTHLCTRRFTNQAMASVPCPLLMLRLYDLCYHT